MSLRLTHSDCWAYGSWYTSSHWFYTPPVMAIFDLSMLAGSTESLCLPAGVSIRWMPSLLLFGCCNAIYCVWLYRVLLAGWGDEFSVSPGVFLRMQAVFKKCTHSAGLQRSHLKPDVLWDCSHNLGFQFKNKVTFQNEKEMILKLLTKIIFVM